MGVVSAITVLVLSLIIIVWAIVFSQTMESFLYLIKRRSKESLTTDCSDQTAAERLAVFSKVIYIGYKFALTISYVWLIVFIAYNWQIVEKIMSKPLCLILTLVVSINLWLLQFVVLMFLKVINIECQILEQTRIPDAFCLKDLKIT